MAHTVAPEVLAGLRKELQFVQNLFNTAKTANQYVAAANAAARIASRTVATNIAPPRAATAGGDAARPGDEFSVSICGLPIGRDWNWTRLRKYLTDMGLAPRRVEKVPSQDFGVATFKDSTDLDAALLALSQRDGITATRGKEAAYQEFRGKKRGAEGLKRDLPGKVARGENVCDAVCAWWRRPYGDQLKDKTAKVAAALKRVTSQIDQRSQMPKPAWLAAARESGANKGAGPAVPLEGILRSPLLEHYRNKCEFTVGLDGEEAARVGFLLGSFADGVTMVCDPEPARHTSRLAVQYAQMATDFIRTQAQHPAYDKRKNKDHGFWRLLTVREGRRSTYLPGSSEGRTFTDFDPWQYLVTMDAAAASADGAVAAEPMAVDGAQAEPVRGTRLSEFQEPASGVDVPLPDEVLLMIQVTDEYKGGKDLDKEVEALAAYFKETAAARGLPLTTVAVQLHHGISNAAPYDAPMRILLPAAPTTTAGAAREEAAQASGKEQAGFIHDALLDLRFRISATAFFQVNSAATCVLYKVVGEWAATRPSTLLLDVCCGTGTIGLTLARKVAKVIGVDNVAESIRDAAANAALNGITNCEFVCGKAEDALAGILAQHAGQYDDVVAVLDPPRCGCHKTAIAALLKCPTVRRIVYVSCNPDSLADNMEQLCAPCAGGGGGGGRGKPQVRWEPFHPVRAVAVDLFPHTPHVESVVVMERA